MGNTASRSRRGRDRETDVRDLLGELGWLAVRAASGFVDVLALAGEGATHPVYGEPTRFDSRWGPLVIQVKSTQQSPYERFGPAGRTALVNAADNCRAHAWLVWWPPGRQPQWIHPHEWPT